MMVISWKGWLSFCDGGEGGRKDNCSTFSKPKYPPCVNIRVSQQATVTLVLTLEKRYIPNSVGQTKKKKAPTPTNFNSLMILIL